MASVEMSNRLEHREEEEEKERGKESTVDPELGAEAEIEKNDADNDAAANSKITRVVIASIVGNVLEWFDFGVFAFLAPTIGNILSLLSACCGLRVSGRLW